MTSILDRLRQSKALRLLAACALAVGLVPAAALAASNEAFADQPQTITGTCTVVCTNPGPAGTAEEVAQFDVTMPDGKVSHGHCLDRGQPMPLDGEYRFTGIWNGNSYGITVNSQYTAHGPSEIHPSSAAHYIGAWPTWTQRIGGFAWLPFGSLELQKASADEGMTAGNDCYGLKGAEYGVYESAADAASDSSRAATLTTDESGYAKIGEIGPGTYYVKETNAPKGYALDAKVYTVTVAAGETAHVGGSKVYDTPLNDPDAIVLQKRDIETGNAAAQGGAKLALAEYTFDYYQGVYNTVEDAQASGDPERTWVMRTNGSGITNLVLGDGTFTYDGQAYSYKVSGDDFYRVNGVITLPLGTIVITESKAPEGYRLDSGGPYIARIVQSGNSVEIEGDLGIVDENTSEEGAVSNEQPKRGDLSFEKKGDSDSERMAGVPFMITSETTGESHVAVTDENGQFTSVAEYNAHTANTNANDAAVTVGEDGEYVVDESLLDSEAGIWFGAGEPDDSMGALLYDTYAIEELPCSANKGKQLVKETGVVISRDAWEVDLGTIDDMTASIGTAARDAADGDRTLPLDSEVTATDRTTYAGLAEGETFTIVTKLVDKAAYLEDPIVEPVAETENDFTAQGGGGYVETSVTIDAYELSGHELVFFEYVYDSHHRLVASHEDIEDSEQTLTVVPPQIGTTATDAADGDKIVVSDTEAEISDIVAFSGLMPSKTYTLEGKAIDPATGEPLLDAQGNEIASTLEFIPEASTGTVEAEFAADLSHYEGDIVFYEYLYRGGNELAKHEDPEDESQTVTVERPVLGTTAADGHDGDKIVVADGKATVVDTVHVTGAETGKEYTAMGNLYDPASSGLLMDAEGNPVTSSVTFVAEKPEFDVDVVFEFDASLLGGHSLVAFEHLMRGDAVIASHEDPEDEGQTVTVKAPEIDTVALDAADGDKTVVADPDAKITDNAYATNLISGASYEIYGIVMDGDTGLPLVSAEDLEAIGEKNLKAFWAGLIEAMGLEAQAPETPSEGQDQGAQEAENANEEDATGPFGPAAVNLEAAQAVMEASPEMAKAISMASAEFTAEGYDAAQELDFGLNASDIAGKKAVVFELLAKEGAAVALHADLSDEDQTVEIVSTEIGTEAVDASDGDHNLIASTEAEVVDTLSYTNAIVGKEYVIQGTLMDKATGEPVLANDKPVTATGSFVANQPDGTTQVEFSFDASGLAGHDLVAFEELYKDGILVATHADINDRAQTVVVEQPPIGSMFDKTGGNLAPIALGIASIAVAGTGASAWGIRRSRTRRKDERQAA